MKKLFNRPMKILFCFLVAFSTFMISAPPVQAYSGTAGENYRWSECHGCYTYKGVEINKEQQFGRSQIADNNGVRFWEWGTYEVTAVDDDKYDIIFRYRLTVTDNGALSPGNGVTKQVSPVFARITGEAGSDFTTKNGPLWDQRYNRNDSNGDGIPSSGEKYVNTGVHTWGETRFYGLPRGTTLYFQILDQFHSDAALTEIDIKGDVYIPKMEYTVNFYNSYTPTAVDTQIVKRYGSATAPADPSALGYKFTGWDKGFTNVTSNLDVYAKWNRLNPEIKIRETVYKKGDYVDLWKLQTNAKAEDTREGNITGRVEVVSDIVHNGIVDTSQSGVWDITYKVTNTDSLNLDEAKSADKHGKIHIIDDTPHTTHINLTDENVYSRYISGNEMMNGQKPVNDLKPYSVWSRTGLPNMWTLLNNSLNRRTPLFTINGVHGQ